MKSCDACRSPSTSMHNAPNNTQTTPSCKTPHTTTTTATGSLSLPAASLCVVASQERPCFIARLHCCRALTRAGTDLTSRCMRLVCLLLVVTLVASLVPTATAFRIDSMISKFIGKHLPDYTYSVPGMLFYFLDPSHTALGFKAHAACFDKKDLDVDLKGRAVLVAGGNAGIGRSAAQSLAERGATVHIVCRSREKGEQAVADIKTATGNDDVHLHVVDLGSIGQVQAFTKSFAASGKPLHVLVNNAATMQSTRSVTSEGIETAQATNLLGFYGLTRGLLPVLKQNAPARIVNVVSAGMLASQFKLKGLTEEEKIEPYDGAAVYSLHHRARVMLTETWAEELKESKVVVNCVHPGWVDTPLLRAAGPMEGFYKLMRGSLRTEPQGADTIVWLAASKKGGESTGRYFFDRKARWTNLLFANTKPEKKDYGDLVAFCEGKCPVGEEGK